ncbi:MAG: NADAR family protein [Alphaproteobacteria bacterium]
MENIQQLDLVHEAKIKTLTPVAIDDFNNPINIQKDPERLNTIKKVALPNKFASRAATEDERLIMYKALMRSYLRPGKLADEHMFFPGIFKALAKNDNNQMHYFTVWSVMALARNEMLAKIEGTTQDLRDCADEFRSYVDRASSENGLNIDIGRLTQRAKGDDDGDRLLTMFSRILQSTVFQQAYNEVFPVDERDAMKQAAKAVAPPKADVANATVLAVQDAYRDAGEFNPSVNNISRDILLRAGVNPDTGLSLSKWGDKRNKLIPIGYKDKNPAGSLNLTILDTADGLLKWAQTTTFGKDGQFINTPEAVVIPKSVLDALVKRGKVIYDFGYISGNGWGKGLLDNKYACFSNYFPYDNSNTAKLWPYDYGDTFTYLGRNWSSSEAAYHAIKVSRWKDGNASEDYQGNAEILDAYSLLTADDAMREARQYQADNKPRGPFATPRDMYNIVLAKFKHLPNLRKILYLRKILLDTGDAILIEGADAHIDVTWGAITEGPYVVGKNQLGRVLMAVRAQLRAEKAIDTYQALSD